MVQPVSARGPPYLPCCSTCLPGRKESNSLIACKMSSESSLSHSLSLSCECLQPPTPALSPPCSSPRFCFSDERRQDLRSAPEEAEIFMSSTSEIWKLGPRSVLCVGKTAKNGVEGQCRLAAGLNLVQKLGSWGFFCIFFFFPLSPSSKETKEVAAPAVGHLGEQPQEFRGSAPVLHPSAASQPCALCLGQLG